MPAATLAAFWLGGEALLIAVAFLVPLACSALGPLGTTRPCWTEPRDDLTGVPFRDSGEALIDEVIVREGKNSLAVMAVGLDDFDEVGQRYGPSGRDQILAKTAARIASVVRQNDLVVRLAGADFVIVMSSRRRADLETLVQIASRLQQALAEPMALGGMRVYLTASVGFATGAAATAPTGATLIVSAEQALDDARANGIGSVRAFSPGMVKRRACASALTAEVDSALFDGQIVPWFQPQVRTDTGALSGVEALARWAHPTRGLLLPADFLPAVEDAGAYSRLGERMLHCSLAALRNWDRAGFSVPTVAVNFAAPQLRDPHLVDRLRWELDRFGLAPERLTVEVLETVISTVQDDTIVRNLRALADFGCGIDLDDFGTGHAAIGSIRRFSVRRIKIDRTFVTRLDTDEEQQNLVSAILLMADRLKIDTLAEGVETPAEHGILLRLGCGHVQGYGVARPMPEHAMSAWISEREGLLGAAPSLAGICTAGTEFTATGDSGKTA